MLMCGALSALVPCQPWIMAADSCGGYPPLPPELPFPVLTRPLCTRRGISPPPQEPALRQPLVRAGALAVADFWARIADFVAVGEPLPQWENTVGDDHPFISHGGSRVNMGIPTPPRLLLADPQMAHDPSSVHLPHAQDEPLPLILPASLDD